MLCFTLQGSYGALWACVCVSRTEGRGRRAVLRESKRVGEREEENKSSVESENKSLTESERE